MPGLRAGGKDYLAIAARLPRLVMMQVGDPSGALAVEEHAGGERFGLDAQIGAAPCRIQKSPRRRPAAAILLGGLEIAETFLVVVVVVGIVRETFGHRGLDNGICQLGAFAQRGNVEGTAAAARIITARLVVLGFLEIGQHPFVRPAAVAELGPGVVVERVAADIDHAVDRTRSPEGLAARDRDRAAVEVRLRLGGEPPIVARVVEQLHEARRDVDPH